VTAGLAPGEVHVRGCDLDALPEPLPPDWLSPDERQRAARYRQARERTRFEQRRAWLRRLLGGYLGQHPARVQLRAGPHGQPALAGCAWLRFSLSRAGGRAICVVSAGRRVGADLARVELAAAGEAALLAAGERAALDALPAAARAAAFHRAWTRREAYLKARGEGLAAPRDAFEVSLAPARWTRLARCAFDPREPARWRFLLLEPWAGHVAAIAVELDPGEIGAPERAP
jgi:4'-phosphopantetheinyl transferase